jgi:predicted dehydrogenase
MAVAALELGLAVYLEKPMAITTEGCDRILKTARESNARLYLGHNMRHMAFVRKMKELIDGGAIGEVKRFGVAISWATAAISISRIGTRRAKTPIPCCCKKARTTST